MTNQPNRVDWPDDLLTSAELEVLFHLLNGLNNTEIARVKDVAPATIRFHVRNIREKLGVDDRQDLIDRFTEDPVEGVKSVKVEETGPNVKAITARAERIWTVEQLLEAMEIGLDEWEITKIVGNKWEGYRSGKIVNLTYEGGRIEEGSIEDLGGLIIEPLIQVKVWLVRKHPVEVHPMVHPVHINMPTPGRSTPRGGGVESALILPDTQFGFERNLRTGKLTPYHDREALDIALQLAESYEFDYIFHLGDVVDLANFTKKFKRTPEQMYGVMHPTFAEAVWWLAQFRQTARMAVLEGNHDVRLPNLIMDLIPALYELHDVWGDVEVEPVWSLAHMLKLDELGIKWVPGYPNNQVWLNDWLVVEHGNVSRKGSGDTAAEINKHRTYSTIFGHIHRTEIASRIIRDRHGQRTVWAMSPGFLGHIDGRVPGHRPRTQEWSQGVGIVQFASDSPHIFPTFVPIESGQAIYDGMLWTARDRLDDLIDSTGIDWGL